MASRFDLNTPPVAVAAVRPLIEIDRVSKIYQTRDGPVESLKPLTFDIGAGEFMAIVGPSGCGKSTLLKMVGGLLPASAGEIRLDGRRVAGPPDNVGIVFQSSVLLAWRSVLENVMLQIEMRHLPKAQYLPKARALLEMTGLADFANKHPWELSGGMQQRASICRALVHDPAVLLMDEPFGALDAITRTQIRHDLELLWMETRKTVLFITHSIEEAIGLSDRVLVMSPNPGRIVDEIAIDLPRPRPAVLGEDASFNAYAERIHRAFLRMGVIKY